MANLFFNLPVTPGNGAGAGVDVSQLGMTRTITVGGSFSGTVHVEGSAEGIGGPWAPITSFATVADEFVVNIAAPFMRVRRSGVPGVGAPGLPNVDVAGNDNGCLFADLPPPPANGVGASVDVSNLGTFKTVYCLGAWVGTVNIEFSEDGVDWSQITSFTNPGQRSKPFTAKFMRASRSGVPPTGAPGLPNVDVAAVNDPLAIPGGDGGCCHLIYQPEGPHEGPSVFNDFGALYAQLLAFRAASNGSGFYTIGFDDEFTTPCVVPAETYDFAGCTWVPFKDPTNGAYVEVELAIGVVLQNLFNYKGPIRVTSLGTSAPVTLANDEYYDTRDGASVRSATAAGYFDATNLDADDPPPTFQLDDIATLGDGVNPVIISDVVGSTVVFTLGSQAEVLANALDFAAGAILSTVWRNSSASIDGNQPAFLGTFSRTDLVLDRWRIRFETGAAVAAVLGDHIGSTPPISGQVVTLPLGTQFSSGQQVAVKRLAAANTLTVVPTGVQTVEGVASLSLPGAADSIIFTWDGVSNWRATAGFGATAGGGNGTIISFANDNIGGGAFTRYISPWNGGNSSVAASGAAGLAELQYPLARGGTLRNLIVRHDAGPIPPPPSVLITYTLLVNGVATALTVTLAATAGAQAIDLVNSVVVVQGDLVALEAVKTGVVAPPLIFVRAGVELV